MEKAQFLRKIGKITANVLLYTFIALCIIGVVITISSKKEPDGTATVFGRQMRVVLSSSMEKCDATDVSAFEIKDIPVGSMVFIETVPEDKDEAEKWYADLKEGDVLTIKYVYARQETITHRITGIRQNPDGGYTIRLDGDNKDSDAETLTQEINTSEKLSPNYVVGKVTGQSLLMGMMVTTMKSPVGIVFLAIIPATVIAVFEIMKIFRLLTAERRLKDKKEIDRQRSELDDLRRRLAELEGKGSEQSGGNPAENGSDEA